MKQSKRNFKRLCTILLTLVLVCSLFPATPVFAAENLYGGWTYALTTKSVYDSVALNNVSGAVYAGEGISILVVEANSYYIEYSTSNGTKRGYITKDNLYMDDFDDTCIGRMTATSTVYYCPSFPESEVVGTVYLGEYVVILAEHGGRYYIEYNTNSGRKRGFVLTTNVNDFNKPSTLDEFYKHEGSSFGSGSVTGRKYVYAGPSTVYPSVGYVENESFVILAQFVINGQQYTHISYPVGNTGLYKRGYLMY